MFCSTMLLSPYGMREQQEQRMHSSHLMSKDFTRACALLALASLLAGVCSSSVSSSTINSTSFITPSSSSPSASIAEVVAAAGETRSDTTAQTWNGIVRSSKGGSSVDSSSSSSSNVVIGAQHERGGSGIRSSDSGSDSVTGVTGGADWSGDMHPGLGLGANPACNHTSLTNCAPSYAQLKAAGKLWPCPDGRPEKDLTCGAGPLGCVKAKSGGGGNPLCTGQLSDEHPCCCPKDGCAAQPLFNTVIGVCRSTGCACGGSNTRANSCAPEGQPLTCGTSTGTGGKACTGKSVPCCFGHDVSALVPYYDLGTQALINYWAAYQFDPESKTWKIQSESSFNTDARFPPHNLTAKQGGIGDKAWLAPQPGGSAFWSAGYYAAGVRGVGAPGAMFVLSTEQLWGATWYMLNQLTIDRGPAIGYPAEDCKVTNDNCWASGNAGEFDMLETSWNNGNLTLDPLYQRSFSTQWNQIGRCFNGGVNAGGFGSPNYLVTSPPSLPAGAKNKPPEPIVYVAVVDSVGNWVYRVPASQVETIWPGLTRKTAAAELPAAPTKRPEAVNPCTGGYCLVFTSNCQAENVTAARAQNCGFNGDQGFCGNWWRDFADTKQPLFPASDCEKDVRGGVEMPWCKVMVNAN